MMKKVIAVFILGLVAGAILGAQQVMSLTPERSSNRIGYRIFTIKMIIKCCAEFVC